MEKIPPATLVPFDLFLDDAPYVIDLAYARADHPENLFGQIYHPDARMSGHVDMVCLAILAARALYKETGWTLVIKDCLRPVEAQQRMMDSDAARANPGWFRDPPLLSRPGQGGHPRGMAIDVAVAGVDMGTPFDGMSEDQSPLGNPAHREYVNITHRVRDNRSHLDRAMLEAARQLGIELLPLPQEWWDFRIPSRLSSLFAPFSDADLPGPLRMLEPQAGTLDNVALRALVSERIGRL